MLAIEQFIHEQGYSYVTLHAQIHAKPFYKLLGYSTVGQPFMEEQIEHIKMENIFINITFRLQEHLNYDISAFSHINSINFETLLQRIVSHLIISFKSKIKLSLQNR